MTYVAPTQRDLANAIRFLAADAVEQAASGHPGMPMGMADVGTVLFTEFLTFNPADPLWPNRDRFVLSAGHGSMFLYALLYLTGYPGMTLEQLQRFRQLGSLTAGHPEVEQHHGIETTTGPLGQGLANAVGMALGEAKMRHDFGAALFNHYTYVIAGDGCLMEGISQEAISFAGHHQLGHLIVLFDDNEITIDGPTSLSTSDDTCARFAASHWHVQRIDGHDMDAIRAALKAAQASAQPSLIACKTTIGYGALKKAGSAAAHGAPLGAEELAAARDRLGWPHEPFQIPERVLATWRAAGARHAETYAAWQKQWAMFGAHAALEQRIAGALPAGWDAALKEKMAVPEWADKAVATRQSSQMVLDQIASHVPALLGGSADLTGSNNTQGQGMAPLTKENLGGHYIYYGIREHAMGAIMNGLALYGGFIPYGGTFLTFSDYARPAMRLSALMRQRVIYVMTHDSIGLGEDGPTHQPIEHLMSLRLIPNMLVFRPADTLETAACWHVALTHQNQPSVLALSRQSTPALPRADAQPDAVLKACAQGAYRVRTLGDERRFPMTIIASGTEVALALAVQELLQDTWCVHVVSMPCWTLFWAQAPEVRAAVIDPESQRVSIEWGATLGWERIVGEHGLMMGLDTFGASAPLKDLVQHFGMTPEAIAARIRAHF